MKTVILAVVAAFSFIGVAYAQEAPVRLCTGASTGVYYDAGMTIKRWSKKLPIEVIETNGSLDNVQEILGGSCDAIIAQPDALNKAATDNPAVKKILRPVGTLHREYLHVLCGRESDYDNLNDLEGTEASLNIGPPGSGSWVTWQNIVAEDDGYASIKTQSDENNVALGAVAQGETDCMLITSGLNAPIMQSADNNYGDQLKLVGADDKDFNDALDVRGKPMYTKTEISAYPNINNGWSSPNTISWNASVYVNTDSLNGKRLSTFVDVLASSRGEIISRYGK